MINTKGVVHFTIPVSNLDRSEKFYTELLGFKFVRKNPHMVFLQSGDDYFVLTLSENPIDPNPGDKHDIHTAFLVGAEDYDSSLEYLAQNGVKVFLEERRTGSSTFTGRSAYFHDPDRNVLELLDPMDG